MEVDGKAVAEGIQGEEYTLDLSRLRPGKHRVTLVANGAQTYFALAPEKLTVRSSAPLPLTSTIEFTFSPSSQ